MKPLHASLFHACLAAGSSLVLPAGAAMVVVPNHSFENYQAIGDGTTGAGWASFPASAENSIENALTINDEFWANPSNFGSGWQSNGPQPSNGKFGLQHPSLAQHSREGDATLTAPGDGYFLGFMNLPEGDAPGASAGSVQSAVVGELAAGTYTLTIALGSRAVSNWNDVGYSFGLVAEELVAGTGTSGGTMLGFPSQSISVPVTLTPETRLQDFTYQFTVPEDDGLIGEAYAIRIDMTNLGTRDGVSSPNGINDFTQANFDNVRLDFVAIPEPSAALLGLLGLSCIVRRRR